MNNNINYQMAKAEILLQQVLTDLPVGIAYYILKTKADQLKQLYYQQAEREAADAAQETPQNQNQEKQLESVEGQVLD